MFPQCAPRISATTAEWIRPTAFTSVISPPAVAPLNCKCLGPALVFFTRKSFRITSDGTKRSTRRSSRFHDVIEEAVAAADMEDCDLTGVGTRDGFETFDAFELPL